MWVASSSFIVRLAMNAVLRLLKRGLVRQDELPAFRIKIGHFLLDLIELAT